MVAEGGVVGQTPSCEEERNDATEEFGGATH